MRFVERVVVFALGSLLARAAVKAQGVTVPSTSVVQLADRGPVFYAAPGARAAGIDVRRTSIFRERVSVHMTAVSLTAALAEVSRQAHLEFSYAKVALPADVRVSLNADNITVASALNELLLDSGLDVQVGTAGFVALVSHDDGLAPAPGRQQATGTVAGRVIDATTKVLITQATISVVGTTLSAGTRVDGTYRITGVIPGSYRVTARRVGYQPLTRDVTVSADQTAAVDFALVAAPTHLNEVVTTVTGDAKKYQVGNLIETMQADSVMKSAPVTDLGDLINARVPGVQVFEPGGVTGASPQINIRGQNSLTVSNQPLLVIDGVRVENSSAGDYGSQAGILRPAEFNTFFGGRLNDLNPEEVENIEVVKGPSAAALYGTAAANGVILVTTKRGTAGAPHWNFSAEGGALTMDKNRFPYGYYAWGHTTDGTHTAERCLLVMKAAGSCVVDSITHFSPLRDPATTIISTGYRQQYGGQVSGGAGQTRYFVSGTYADEVAPIKMPAADQTLLATERGGVGLEPDNVRPNALNKGSARVNLATALGPSADLALSGGLITQEGRIPTTLIWIFGEATPGYRDSQNGWGFGYRPAGEFAVRNREDVTHTTGSATSTWRPTGWLTGRFTTGLDYSSNYLDELIRPGENLDFPGGRRTNGRVNIALYSGDAVVTAAATLVARVSSKTSAGVQYVHRAELDNAATAANLAPGTVSVAGGALQTATEANVETIIAGGYGEQTFGLNDRLFVTGGLRADGGSAFGQGFGTAVYPKASASWLVSQEPWMFRTTALSSIRFRAAYGASGVQPGPTDALTTVTLNPAAVDGAVTTGGLLGSLGDLHLKPEKQTEFEVGVDLEGLARRVQVSATYYSKISTDALVSVPVAAFLGTGSGTQEINVGSVRNRGYEVSASADLVQSRLIDWAISINGSANQNRLLKLAPGFANLGLSGFAASDFAVGYPLFAAFNQPFGYRDANGDGVIESSEVTVGPKSVYFGSHYPTAQLTWSTTVGLWRERLQLHAQVDSRSGSVLENLPLVYLSGFGWSRAENDPTASLRDQAAAQAYNQAFTTAGYVESGSFTRLREVSLTYNVPPSLTRIIRGRSASVALAGRNLALWTHYRGADPEVNSGPQGGSNAYYDLGGAPMTQYWIVRVRMGL